MKPINIEGYETYHVNEFGVVLNSLTGRILKPDLNSAGYQRITLMVNSKRLRMTVHRIVALTHLSDTYRDNLVVNHKDGNKLNNHYKNLEWITSSENRKHAFKNKLCKRPNSRLSDNEVHDICSALQAGHPARNICDHFNIPEHVLYDIRSRRYYKDISAGYFW